MNGSKMIPLFDAQSCIIHAYKTGRFREELKEINSSGKSVEALYASVQAKLLLIITKIFPERQNKEINEALEGIFIKDKYFSERMFIDRQQQKPITKENVEETVIRLVSYYIRPEWLLVRAFLADVIMKQAEEVLGDLGWGDMQGIYLCYYSSMYPKPVGIVLPSVPSRSERGPRFVWMEPFSGGGVEPHRCIREENKKIFGSFYPTTLDCKCLTRASFSRRILKQA